MASYTTPWDTICLHTIESLQMDFVFRARISSGDENGGVF